MDHSSLPYILSQIFTILMYILLAGTYISKNKRTILLLDIASLISIDIAYVLLGAWTGLAMCIISIFRDLYVLWTDNQSAPKTAQPSQKSTQPTQNLTQPSQNAAQNQTPRNHFILLLILLAIILTTIPAYDGLPSLLSVFATILFTLAIWQKSTKIYKFCGIPAGLLWLAYNIYIDSFFGIILEFIIITAAIIGFISELHKPNVSELRKPKTSELHNPKISEPHKPKTSELQKS